MEEAKRQINKHIIGFHSLVKNRLGPYHIIVQDSYKNYLTNKSTYRALDLDIDNGVIYYGCGQSPFVDAGNYNGKVFLITAAGNIPLEKKDVHINENEYIK